MRPCLIALLAAAGCAAQSLTGVVDVHAHFGPDVIPRSIDALALVRLAKERGFRAIVLKNHNEPTATLAALARKQTPGIEVFGSIALNRAVGGINPAAVERMLRVEGGHAKVVCLPTFDSENNARSRKGPYPPVPVARGGKLLPELVEVLDLIAKHDLVLATGHLTPAEILEVIAEARKRGVKRILVTHAMLGPVNMSVPQMREAARLGAMIEFVGNSVVGSGTALTFRQMADAMRQVGIENSVLSSDFGQADNPLHPDGLEQTFRGLRAEGLSAAAIDRMAKSNPARLLGFPER